MKDAKRNTMSALSIRELRKIYPNGIAALRGINLVVEEGDFFALLGPNGAGKSTVIGIICSLIKKTTGQITIFNHDLDKSPYKVKRCIGLVPQEFNFNQFQLVGEIVVNQAGYYGIPRKKSWMLAEHFLRQLELWEQRNLMARELSGGMKRRLMIARALVHRPRLLILDEPTAGVDIEIRRSMWEFLQEINTNGTTIILTTHYLEEAESLCRNLAIIAQGQILEQSSLSLILNRLYTETFLLDLRSPLQAPLTLPDYNIKQLDNLTLEVTVTKPCGLNRLFAYLSAQGIEIISMRNKQNRLEQLFINQFTAVPN